MARLAFVVLVLGACGGDDGGGTTMVDAPAGSMNKVMTVSCPTTADATVMTTSTVDAYMPMSTTVPVNAVVKFVMASTHNVAPNPLAAMTDQGLNVGFGQTACLKFTQAGTYGFYCSTHSFAGTIVVQ